MGSELNRQVAEAIGWAGGEPVPDYSGDLNAAMEAARKVDATLKLVVMPSGAATAQFLRRGFVVGLAEDLPPAEAICRAIVG